MSTNASSDDYPDQIVTPGEDGRIMRSPDDADVAGGTSSGSSLDIESTDEATESSYTAHMDDDTDDPSPAGADA